MIRAFGFLDFLPLKKILKFNSSWHNKFIKDWTCKIGCNRFPQPLWYLRFLKSQSFTLFVLRCMSIYWTVNCHISVYKNKNLNINYSNLKVFHVWGETLLSMGPTHWCVYPALINLLLELSDNLHYNGPCHRFRVNFVTTLLIIFFIS